MFTYWYDPHSQLSEKELTFPFKIEDYNKLSSDVQVTEEMLADPGGAGGRQA